MPTKKSTAQEHAEYHKNGSIWAKGQTTDGIPTGYWEWFKKDGTRMRSGYFNNGEQTRDWTTYGKSGEVYKITTMKPKTN